MKTSRHNAAKQLRLFGLCLWGLLSLLYIAGEPIDAQMPFGRFCLLKAAGLLSLAACAWVGRCLRKAGLTPND